MATAITASEVKPIATAVRFERLRKWSVESERMTNTAATIARCGSRGPGEPAAVDPSIMPAPPRRRPRAP